MAADLKLNDQSNIPILTFPPEEEAHIRRCYDEAAVILEYGSGGSTFLAASMREKFVMSVETDRAWAIELQKKIDGANLPSPAIVYHADIGPTGEWGRPIDDSNWRQFFECPTRIWAEPFFLHPDLVLIDGRFRAATLVAVFLRIQKPVTVLFDDYVNRRAYHPVEALVKPISTHGRMAKFLLEPGPREPWMFDLFVELIGKVRFATENRFPYLDEKIRSIPDTVKNT